MTTLDTGQGSVLPSSAGPSVPTGRLRAVPAAEWDAVLERLGALDVYSCAAYHAASALLEPPGTRPVLLHAEQEAGEMVLPLLLRPIPGGGWDATSAYGYGGPSACGDPDIGAFGNALDEWARAHSVVASFLRLNPLTDNVRWVPPTADLVTVGPTVAWDLTAGRDLRGQLNRNHLRSVRKAEAAGLVMTVVPRPRGLDRFRELYEQTMRRQGASDFFFFPTGYWDALLVPDATLFPVLIEARSGDRVVAALLCLVSDRWVHAHLLGTDDGARSIGASHRCYLTAAEWAQSQGLIGMHMGGGVGADPNSSLYTFKRRFDPTGEPRAFEVAKLVHDRKRYRQLAGDLSTEGFFPPWRRPG